MRPLATLITVALAAGCAGSWTDPGPNADIVGVYAVRMIGGAPPPLQFYTISADSTVEFIGGALTLTPDSTWSAQSYDRTTIRGVVTIDTGTTAGTFARAGTSLVFSGPTITATHGTVANDTIRVTFGLPYVYVREHRL